MSLDLGLSYEGIWRRQSSARRTPKVVFYVPTFHLRRIPIEIRPEISLGNPEVVQGGAIFAPDLSTELARIISDKPLKQYQKIQITINDSTPFHIVGWVKWCRPVSLSNKVISSNPLKYRIEIRFDERSRVEQHRFQSFLAEFRDRYIFSERF